MTILVKPSFLRLLTAVSVGAEEYVGAVIRQYPVVFFGHLPVKRPEACFDMCYRDIEFYRCKSACKGGVRVAINENPIRFFFDQELFDLFQHAACHCPVVGAVDAEVVVWLWNI